MTGTVQRGFRQVDVFGGGPLAGNPLAVVADAEGLSADTMQRLARWTNLSETAFLLPPTSPDADYRVRIFTTARELPFAGHPTLGACHAWLQAGGEPAPDGTVVQECGAGLVTLRRESGRLGFAGPPLRRAGAVDDADVHELAAVLGLADGDVVEARWADNGPGWVALLLEDADAVLAVEPRVDRWSGRGTLDVGLVGPARGAGDHDLEVRALFTDEGGRLIEDPVTGSLNAAVAPWLLDSGRVTAPYVVRQGTRLDRDGRVHVDRDADGTVWVSGATVTVIDGHIEV